MKEMNTNEVVDLLLVKETEISNKFHHAITEILRLGYDTERGKSEIPDLIDSVKYTLDDMERIIKR